MSREIDSYLKILKEKINFDNYNNLVTKYKTLDGSDLSLFKSRLENYVDTVNTVKKMEDELNEYVEKMNESRTSSSVYKLLTRKDLYAEDKSGITLLNEALKIAKNEYAKWHTEQINARAAVMEDQTYISHFDKDKYNQIEEDFRKYRLGDEAYIKKFVKETKEFINSIKNLKNEITQADKTKLSGPLKADIEKYLNEKNYNSTAKSKGTYLLDRIKSELNRLKDEETINAMTKKTEKNIKSYEDSKKWNEEKIKMSEEANEKQKEENAKMLDIMYQEKQYLNKDQITELSIYMPSGSANSVALARKIKEYKEQNKEQKEEAEKEHMKKEREEAKTKKKETSDSMNQMNKDTSEPINQKKSYTGIIVLVGLVVAGLILFVVFYLFVVILYARAYERKQETWSGSRFFLNILKGPWTIYTYVRNYSWSPFR